MKLQSNYTIWLCGLLLGLIGLTGTSCQFEDAQPAKQALEMTFNIHQAELWLGDTLTLRTIFTPDTVTAPKAFWYKYDPQVALDVNENNECRVIGTQRGEAWVYAVTLNEGLRDSCLVTVKGRWEAIAPHDYEYDAIVYADVEIDGTHNAPRYEVAAFIDGEMRGLGRVFADYDIPCTVIRIYSNRVYGDEVTFRYYDSQTMTFGELDYQMTFDGLSHGTLNNSIKMKNKTAEI